MALIDLKDLTIKLRDGTAVTPLELEIKIGTGNITWTESFPMDYTNDKGVLDKRRRGDQVAMTVNLNVILEYYEGLTLGSVPSPIDALKRIGHAAAWVSTDPDPCAPYCLDLVVENVPACVGTDLKETYVFPQMALIEVGGDMSESTLSIQGSCMAQEPTTTREDIA